ncbi:MAG: MAPEG family protein [Pseudomonadota bacterium]
MVVYTPVYAALLAVLFLVLSFRVIGARRGARVALGDGGDRALQRRMRVHANFAEYAPLCLILMALAELQDRPGWLINLIGLLLLAGRAAHAYGVSGEPEVFRWRVGGMVMTFTALGIAAMTNLGFSLFIMLA